MRFVLLLILFTIVFSQDEVIILREYYNSTGGPNWDPSCQDGWNDSNNSDYCNWAGIECMNGFIGINSAYCNLKGTLPSSFSLLQNLVVFEASSNELSGPLPPFPPYLARLRLGQNQFTGPIPDHIWNCTLLMFLDFGDNQFEGPISPNLKNLVNLEQLLLHNNRLTGPIPDGLSPLKKLQAMYLMRNRLTGVVPPKDFVETMGNLMLDRNNFDSISAENMKNKSFTQWSMIDCGLSGSIPESIVEMDSLTLFDASFNNLTGTIPVFGKSIRSILLKGNQITGTFPYGFFDPGKLSVVDVTGNRMSGPINITQLTEFAYAFKLSGNNFKGSIPKEFFHSGVAQLDFSDNDFEGPIPGEIYWIVSYLLAASFEGNPKMKSLFNANNSMEPYFQFSSKSMNEGGYVYSCKQVSIQRQFEVGLSPSYFNYRGCECSRGFVGSPPSNCVACPSGCTCNSGEEFNWPAGSYPIFANGMIHQCFACPQNNPHDPQCNPNGNCSAKYNGEISSDCALCKEGSDGRLCSECHCNKDGACYFWSGQRCLKCDSIKSVIIYFAPVIGILGIFIIVAIVIATMKKTKKQIGMMKKVQSKLSQLFSCVSPGVIKIMLIFLQTMNALNSMWPADVMKNAMRFFNLTNAKTTGIGLPCLFFFMANPVTEMIVNAVIPLAIITFTIVVSIIGSLIGKYCKKPVSNDNRMERLSLISYQSITDFQNYTPSTRESIAYYLIAILYFFYFDLANQTFSVFNCQKESEVTNVRYMQDLPWLKCDSSTDWKYLRLMAIINLGVYVIGIPLLFAILLAIYRKRSSEFSIRYWLGNTLYKAYRPEMFMFELVVIVRRLVLAVLISVVERGSIPQIFGIYAALMISLAIQNYFMPYHNSIENKLEELSLLTVTLSYTAQIASNYNRNIHQSEMAIVTLMMMAIVLVVMLASLLRISYEKMKKKKQEMSFSSRDSQISSLTELEDEERNEEIVFRMRKRQDSDTSSFMNE